MQQIGELGEKLVALWLEYQGYQLLHQRWRCRWGEIDLIALEKSSNTLIFVEVKTRSQGNWDADGMLAINAQKQQKITKTAAIFLSQNTLLADYYCRFDVALVNYQQVDRRSNILVKENKYYCQLEQAQPVLRYKEHQLILKDYLQSAFDL
ncbi:MAG: YraN family protein [Xenococcaceae cyanobacterium]